MQRTCAWAVARSADLALVEWRDAVAMNRALGRLSTLLEHPAHRGRLVSHAQQRRLPSASYLGHNLYADTLRSFESLAAAAREAEAAASPAELAFLAGWAERGAPQVVVSYVSGATPTLEVPARMITRPAAPPLALVLCLLFSGTSAGYDPAQLKTGRLNHSATRSTQRPTSKVTSTRISSPCELAW